MRHFNETLDAYYDYDHQIFGTLSIKTSNHDAMSFVLPNDVYTATENPDGSIDQRYSGEIAVTVDCDEMCSCSMTKQIPDPLLDVLKSLFA